jgi:hypothetical protein
MPDERTLTLLQADRARSDFAAIEGDVQFIMGQLARTPTRAFLCRTLLLATASIWALLAVVLLRADSRLAHTGRITLSHLPAADPPRSAGMSASSFRRPCGLPASTMSSTGLLRQPQKRSCDIEERAEPCLAKMVRTRLPAGAKEIRTCMGLFLSSSRFGLMPVLCSEREGRSSSRRLRSGSRSARKGSRDRNASRA